MHLRNGPVRAGFGIGFCILFAFIGTFTYVNFVLTRPPLSLSPMQLGFVYFVFLPSIFTTPLAGAAVQRFGTQPTLWGGLATAGLGLPLLVTSYLPAVLAGMVLVGVGTFFAQATATGFVSRAATTDRGSASGIYLASYFSGGLVGSAILGQLFDRLGWGACVVGIALSLLAAAVLAARLQDADNGLDLSGATVFRRGICTKPVPCLRSWRPRSSHGLRIVGLGIEVAAAVVIVGGWCGPPPSTCARAWASRSTRPTRSASAARCCSGSRSWSRPTSSRRLPRRRR